MEESINEIILNSIVDGVFTVDPDWKITYFNAAAERITGIPAGEAVGRFCAEIFKADVCEGACVLRRTIETGEPICNEMVKIMRSDGKTLRVSVSTALLKDKDGNVIGGVETFRDMSTEFELRKKLTKSYSFEDIISKNHRIQELFDILPDIAGSDSTVLIEGESGTGKELIARAIHFNGARREKPFVVINCAAIPRELLESELFGHERGAFTGAVERKIGKFEAAHTGTIFLDEIGELDMSLQAKLLRVIQTKQFERVGGVDTLTSDARVISATNRDLLSMAEQREFREDLYYRLSTFPIKLPPLRERPSEIPLLAEHFLTRFSEREKRPELSFHPDTLSLLSRYSWPGNVRELQSIIERSVLLAEDDVILPQDLPQALRFVGSDDQHGISTEVFSSREDVLPLEKIKEIAVRRALELHDGNISETARALQIGRTTLYDIIRKFDISV